MKGIGVSVALTAVLFCTACSSLSRENREQGARVYEDAAVVAENGGNPVLAKQHRRRANTLRRDIPGIYFAFEVIAILFGD